MSRFIEFEFSNMLPCDLPIAWESIEYKTVENFYQAIKFKDLTIRNEISLMDPHEAKKYANKNKKKIREDWQDIKIKVMRMGLNAKFYRNSSWLKKLLVAKTPIVETNNWHDNFWGNCICPKCENIEGQNNLGLLLMEIKNATTN